MLPAAPALAAHVPFVGCRSDGQQGPQPPPPRLPTPDLPRAAAARLAYYATADGMRVLAPRGWQCFGGAGSSGSTIIVAPRPLGFDAIVGERPLRGPVVTLALSFGGTSGRFEVAEVAARMFPAARRFVESVEAEGILDRRYARGPFPADRLTYRGPWQLLYTTPAGKRGLGTRGRLAPDALPVDGVQWLHPDGDMDLTSLAMRLPPGLRPLVAEIIRNATPPPRAACLPARKTGGASLNAMVPTP